MSASAREGDIAIQVRIRGRVQGVGFRDWTMRRAEALGLRGWVRNRADGSVEALFAGPRAAVEHMVADCHRGPSMARVDSVDTESASANPGPGFTFRPTA